MRITTTKPDLARDIAGPDTERLYVFTIRRNSGAREIRRRRMTQPESERYLSWLACQPWTYSATCTPEIVD